MTRALHALPAHALGAAFAAGELSPVEVAQSVLGHVERWERHLHALYLLRPEAVLAQARASEARWRAGTPRSALDGVPITLKDNIATQGDPTPLGTAALPLVPAAADAPPAARVREAGLVVLAKTTMPDFGMLSSGLSSFHATARNPWDLSKTPGGSSAGAGAAAAAGYGPLHVGTDIGGSIRLPAGWCGIVGFKPSLGRIPIDPPYLGRVAGPMTRTVRDAALLMAVLTRPDARDHMSLPAQAIAWDRVPQGPARLGGLKIGLHLEPGCGLPVEPAVREAVARAARLLEAQGAHVEPLAPFTTPEMLAGIDAFFRMRSFVEMQALGASSLPKLLPFLQQWAEGAQQLDGPATFRAFSQTVALRQATVRATQPFDYVLSPVAPVPAFAAELPCPTNDVHRPLEHIAFTLAYNMSEQPAISVPCGFTPEGLPIGLQISGRRFDDLGVLQLAHAYEQLRGPLAAWPEPPSEALAHID